MNPIYDPQFVNKLFNSMSGSYERMNFITSFGFSWLWRKQFIAKIPQSKENIHVLDLLSGLGENWQAMQARFPNAHMAALDFSEEMVLKSQAKNEKCFGGKIEILHEDILESKLPAEKYDVVCSAFGLKTFNEEQLNKLAATLKRILKPRARFSFIEISKPKFKPLFYLYQFYLGTIIPLLGKLFLGNPNDYKMLWVYTKHFSNCQKAATIFKNQGLEANVETYFFGCATGIVGRK